MAICKPLHFIYSEYPCAPKGYAPDEYEYLKEKLSNSNFDLSIESLCRSCKNYAETGRFVEFQSRWDYIKTPKKVLNVLFQNSVWYCSYELTPKSNLIYSLKISNPYIVNLNVDGELGGANVYRKPLTEDEARLWYEAILEEINNNPQERCLKTDYDNLPLVLKSRFMGFSIKRKWEDRVSVPYIKVVDDIKYLILFDFSKHYSGHNYGPSYIFGPDINCYQHAIPLSRDCEIGYNVNIWVRILSVGEEKLSDMIRREEKEIEMEEYIRKQKEEALKREEEERKRREEEERMRKEEEERRKAEEIKRQAEIKYKTEISKLL